MKQLIQSYKTGELGIYDVPAPMCKDNGIIICTKASLVSAGTEKMIIDIAKKSLIGKAKARPDLVKKVIEKVKKEGLINTIEKVFVKLDTPVPLGYSCAGKVFEVGEKVKNVKVGDRVACGGAGYANHSEVNYIPSNLFVKLPDNVDYIEASFVTVGAIALQGVRQANPRIGENVAVMGLGLIGQLTVQILKANGCRVIASDIDPYKLKLAEQLGADKACTANDLTICSKDFTKGYGVDSVIITASTQSNQLVLDAGEILRMRGTVVVVGMVGMDIPRNDYYKKELTLKLSMAYGPGRYDPTYEEKGIDYPYDLVRWTEQRNFEAFLALVSQKRVDVKSLITHQFDFENALEAYQLLEGKKERYLGIILNYPESSSAEERMITLSSSPLPSDTINVGLIGAGTFAKSVIIPSLLKNKEFSLVGVCTSTSQSAHAVGKKYNFRYITTDPKMIFDNKEINTIVISTRHNTHAKYIIEAIKSGKHCFVEKPLCISREELVKIKESYDGKTLLQVGFNRRFSPFIGRIKQEIKNLSSISVIYRISAGIVPPDIWIQDPEVGGGRIIGEVCHFIDTCSFITASPVIAVSASCVHSGDSSIPDEDNVNIILEYKNGSTAVINYYAYGDTAMPKEYIEVFGYGMSLAMNDFRELVIYRNMKKVKYKSSNQDKGFSHQFQEFARAVKTGRPVINVNDIFNTTEVSFAIFDSLKTGKKITLKPC